MSRHRLRILATVLILFLLTAPLAVAVGNDAPPRTPPPRYAMLHVSDNYKRAWEDLIGGGFDVQEYVPGQYIAVIADDDARARLHTMGFSFVETIPDLSDYFIRRFADGADLIAGYPTYQEANDSLWRYRQDRPDIVAPPDTIGRSQQNRPILMLKISDNPTVNENEPEVFYNAMIHSREMITHTALMYFIRYLLTNYDNNPRVHSIVDNRELYFVLTVNPDGMAYNETYRPNGGGMWRKNRRTNPDNSRGVDLNRNFGFHWGYDDYGSSPQGNSETYRGTAGFSEPETQVNRDFCNAHQFRISINYHSYSGDVLHPYSYSRVWTPDHQLLRNLGYRLAQPNNYLVGTPWWLLYPVNGDATDWQYGTSPDTVRNFSYGIEIGTEQDNFWPPQSRIIPLCQEVLETNLRAAEIAGEPRIVLPPPAPELAVDDTAADGIVAWHPVLDVVNPAVSYDLRAATEFNIGVETFASGLRGWLANDASQSPTRAHSETYSITFVNVDRARSYLQSAYPVIVQPGDTLKYWLWYDIETDYDYFFAQISTDEGVTWYSLAGNHTVTTNPHGSNWDFGITGSSQNNWVEMTHPLTDYQWCTVVFRLIYMTDGGTTETGVWIDDISPSVLHSQPWTVTASSLTDTTYQLAEGRWLVEVRARDAEGDTSQWSPPQWIVSLGSRAPETEAEMPARFELLSAAPNPFNTETMVTFSLNRPAQLRLDVYDITGRLATTLLNERRAAGIHRIRWDGGIGGASAPSGMYFLRLSDGMRAQALKAALLR